MLYKNFVLSSSLLLIFGIPLLFSNSFSQEPDCFNLPLIPPIFEDPPITPGNIIDTSFKVTYFCDTIRVDSIKTKGSTWLQILTSPDSFTIIPTDPPKSIDIRFDATGLPPSTYIDTIIIFNNSPPEPRARLPVRLVVSDCGYFRRKNIVLNWSGLRLKISNTSNLADGDRLNGMFLEDDSISFLYDGSSYLATVTADGDTIVARDIFGENFIHPLSDIELIDTILTDSLTYSQALQLSRPARVGPWLGARTCYAVFLPDLKPDSCPWPGPWFGYTICETWWIRKNALPGYILWFKKIYKSPPPCWWPLWPGNLVVNNLYSGSILDWDVPSDSGVINDGGYNDALKYIYQTGRATPYDKYYAAVAAMVDTFFHLKDSTVYSSNGLFGAHILSNLTYIAPGLAEGQLYKWASKPGVSHDFAPYEDITSLLTSICFDTTADTVNYAQALVVTKGGLDSLKKHVENARRDMALSLEFGCDCCYMVGDANSSNSLSLPDIVFLVRHVFQGGPKPIPACLGDCNNTNTINLADIVILVNHIFRGGPKPAKDVDGPCCK